MRYSLFIALTVLPIALGIPNASLSSHGELHEESKIIGGEHSFIRMAPFQVSVRIYGNHICGGVIVSQLHVLTSAHCVTIPAGSNIYSIVAGSTIIQSMFDRNHALRIITRITMHPEYNARTLQHDIAVLALNEALPLNDNTMVAAILPQPAVEVPAGTKAYISGWGLTQEGVPLSRTTRLQLIQIFTLDSGVCQKAYGGRFKSDNSFCAGILESGRDACQGDHGGPLAVGEDKPAERTVYGLIQWAYGCGRQGYPRVYTKLSYYRRWIDGIVSGAKQSSDTISLTYFNKSLDESLNQIEMEPENKIVGGRHAFIRDAPYTVSVRVFLQHICGGVIINHNNILTAAHCVTIPGIGIYNIIAGSTLINGGAMDVGHNNRIVVRVTMHPEYNARLLQNDIAVLTLRDRLGIDHGRIAPALLPPPNIILPANTIGEIAGWGLLVEGGERLPARLQIIQKPVLENACESAYGKRFQPPSVLCAGYTWGGQDACQGDTGGPYVVNRVLWGLINWAYGCARPGYPRVYVSVSYYRQWIDSVINK